MTTKELRDWLRSAQQTDQWWLYLDGVLEEEPLSLSEIETTVRSGDYGESYVLHVSHAEDETPEWLVLEVMNEENEPEPETRPVFIVLGWVLIVLFAVTFGLDMMEEDSAKEHQKTKLEQKTYEKAYEYGLLVGKTAREDGRDPMYRFIAKIHAKDKVYSEAYEAGFKDGYIDGRY